MFVLLCMLLSVHPACLLLAKLTTHLVAVTQLGSKVGRDKKTACSERGQAAGMC